jgi:hypothetical protein
MTINRRQLLRATALGAAGLGLAACSRNSTETPASRSGHAMVTFTVSRPSDGNFQPWVMLVPDTTTSVAWLDDKGNTLSTSPMPKIPLGQGTHQLRLVVADPSKIQMLNFGYAHDQDNGELEDASYDWPKQGVTSITGLNALTGLRMFMCSDTANNYEQVLTGALDLSGMADLVQVECFHAQVTSVKLTGCSSLIRLDLEQNALSDLDINPVRLTLKDLRAAAQSTTALTLAPMTQQFPELWHFCVRDQSVTNILALNQIPKLRQYWVWNTGQTDLGAPASSSIGSILAADNGLTQAAVDAFLIGLDRSIPGNGSAGTAEIGGGTSAVPSPAGRAALAALESKGWNVAVNTEQ